MFEPALLAFAAGAVPLAGVHIGAAVAYGAVALLVLAAMESLRRQHRDAVSDAAERRAEAERVRAESGSREAYWHSFVQHRAEIPEPHYTDAELGAGVAEWFDRLLTAVTEAADDREESQRLSLAELASRVQTYDRTLEKRQDLTSGGLLLGGDTGRHPRPARQRPPRRGGRTPRTRSRGPYPTARRRHGVAGDRPCPAERHDRRPSLQQGLAQLERRPAR